MDNILILGSTGNIGQVVLKHLQGKSAKVFAGVRSKKSFGKATQWGAEPVMVDFTNQESLNQALKDMDRVFLVTPLMQNPQEITQNVIKAAKLNQVKHIVRSTASGADSNGQIQMARWAGASEDLVKESGIDYTILQPSSFLQNFVSMYSYTIREHKSFFAPTGDASFSTVDIEDLGKVAALALTTDDHYNKTYLLSGPTYSYAELAKHLSKVLGTEISYVDVPEEKARESMVSNQFPEWMSNAMMELMNVIKQGWAAQFSDDFKIITGEDYTSAEEYFSRNKAHFV